MKSYAVPLTALALALAAPGYALAQDTTTTPPPVEGEATTAADVQVAEQDKSFAEQATIANMAEVEAGNTALEKSQDQAVRDFAQMMVDDHTAAGDALKEIADNKGLALPTELDEEHQTMVDELAGLEGAEFDRMYAEKMVAGHEKVRDLFQQEIDNGQDPELKSFAEATLPTIEEHLEHAQSLGQPAETAGAAGTTVPAEQTDADAVATTAAGAGADAATTTGDEASADAATTMPAAGETTDQAAEEPAATDTAATDTATAPAPAEEPAATDTAATEPATTEEPAATDTAATEPAEVPAAIDPAATDTATTDTAAVVEPTVSTEQIQEAGTVSLEELIGMDVMGGDGEEIGEVADVITDAETGEARQIVISSGGFLGIGEKDVAVGYADVEVVPEEGQVRVSSLTQADIEAMDEFQYAEDASALVGPGGEETAPATTTE